MRARLPKYPDLELKLREWVDAKIADNPDTTITNEMLKSESQRLWADMEQYQNLETPSFSEGWIEKFKRRTNMPRQRKTHITVNTEPSSLPPSSSSPSSASPSSSFSTNTNMPPKLPPPSNLPGPPSPYTYLPAIQVPDDTDRPEYHPPLPLHPLNTSPSGVGSSFSTFKDESRSIFNIQTVLNPPSSEIPTSIKSSPSTSAIITTSNSTSTPLSTIRPPQIQGPSLAHPPSPTSIISHSVAKSHLQVLKLYIEQHPEDFELRSTFANFERVVDARCNNLL